MDVEIFFPRLTWELNGRESKRLYLWTGCKNEWKRNREKGEMAKGSKDDEGVRTRREEKRPRPA